MGRWMLCSGEHVISISTIGHTLCGHGDQSVQRKAPGLAHDGAIDLDLRIIPCYANTIQSATVKRYTLRETPMSTPLLAHADHLPERVDLAIVTALREELGPIFDLIGGETQWRRFEL